MDQYKTTVNYLRFSIITIVLPVFYLGLWFSISADESMTYFEQVQLLMSYFPEVMRNPFWITLLLFGLSFTSAVLSFFGYLKAATKKLQVVSLFIAGFAALVTAWFGFTLL